MDYQSVFKRYEIKYFLTESQYEEVRSAMIGNAEDDKFCKSVIRNVYYDTPDFRLIRKSLDKPVYKEKLRIRSYKRADKDTKVFVELKKKYKSVVYKRRVQMSDTEAENSLLSGKFNNPSQITNEIEYFLKFYGYVRPAVYISYEREAYKCTDASGVRITFDRNILWRTDNLTLRSTPYGSPVVKDGRILMELKTSGALPMWLVKVLSREKIYKTSFSKYGTVYAENLAAPSSVSHIIAADTVTQPVKKGGLIYV